MKGIQICIVFILVVLNIMRMSFKLAGNDLNNIIIAGHFNDLIDVPSFSLGTIYLLLHFGFNIKFIHSILISIIFFVLACSWELLSYTGHAFGPWQTADIMDIVCYAIGLLISIIYLYIDYSQQKNIQS